ncbi:MAG: error-prone DNA polymerase [Pusillimonas sp.]|nr:error-prone DNA polymerase [Pusillimonas sp.]MBC43545.1 error-prone DNA polymerase [Pusillimonas sp.]|tara:strand:- start:583 stop:3726 length:3144 start_codon:yes stop_codon:yes gene_type:complete
METLTSSLPNYAELDCLSNFTFLKGASHPEELVQQAHQAGYSALALADECSVAGAVRAHIKAQECGLHFIVGSRFMLHHHEQRCGELLVLVANKEGYGNLCQLITLARSRASKKTHYQLNLHDLVAGAPGFPEIRHLPGCLLIFKPWLAQSQANWQHALDTLRTLFQSRLWLGLTQQLEAHDLEHRQQLTQTSAQWRIPLVALGQADMHKRSRRLLHQLLTAIRLGTTIEKCGYALPQNAEHYLLPRFQLGQRFTAASLEQTICISRQCRFSLSEIRYQYPSDTVPANRNPASHLRELTYQGAQQRYPQGIPDNVRQQLEHELGIIQQLEYEAYFLTVHDIVRYALSRNILCQGRGSAANSAVCYCLGITAVNPAHSNALFARFISAERNEPPDIDVDFEHQRREEVIQYIYERYGRHRAALTAVVITYRHRSALRDTGKALGFEPDLINRVCQSCRYWDKTQTLIDKLAEQGLDPNLPRVQAWASLAQKLLGFPRHLSQHPGGFVIANQTLTRLVPVENAAMPNRRIVQWDKDDLDAMGLLKIDVLALGMLSALQQALKMLSRKYQYPFPLHSIPQEDNATYDMISQADTIGVFQIESRAQMSMLPRLRPRTFYDLVIQIAIVRPGPIQGDMVHPYLRRRQGLESVKYPNPKVQHILSRTLGIPIFQEQAMQLAMTAAGFSADEADQLRRSMAAWKRKGGIDHFRPRLISGMLSRGYEQTFIELILRQLEGFGEYGFPESHSASFANLAYASAWIKCHEPGIFLVALLNAQPLGFYGPSQLVQDARRHQVTVLPIDIQHSQWKSSLEAQVPAQAVRLGLHLVKGLSQNAGQRIEATRNTPFTSVHDLATRAQLSRHDIDALAHADALKSLAGHRYQARWAGALLPTNDLLQHAPVLEERAPHFSSPSEGEEVLNDYAATGFSLRRHPLALLRSHPELARFTTANDLLEHYPDKRLARACGLITMRQRPQTANGIIFVSLEDETGIVNIIVRPSLARKQRAELLDARLLGVYGVWQRQDTVCHLIAHRLVNLTHLIQDLAIKSRDFH